MMRAYGDWSSNFIAKIEGGRGEVLHDVRKERIDDHSMRGVPSQAHIRVERVG